MTQTTCRWQRDDEDNFDTECGERFTIIDGKPSDNGMKFCCYCGTELKEEIFNGAC